MAVVKPPSAKEEDELDELPPMDGDGDGDATDETEELDAEVAEGDATDLDDSTGEEDSVPEMEVAGSESGWLDDAGDADGLDVGTPETFGEEGEGAGLLEGAEESNDADEDVAFGNEGESIVGDAGEEGFVDEDEDLSEADLPRLDSGDDDTPLDDEDLDNALPDDEIESEPRPPWDDRAWERADGESAPLAAISALACAPDGVVVAGEGIAWVDAAGKPTALDALGLRGGAPLSVVSRGAWVIVATPRAGVLVSSDGGHSFIEAKGWRAFAGGEEAGNASPVQLVMSAADLWARTKGGALLWSGDNGESWSRMLSEKSFESIAYDASTGELVGITTSRAGAAGERSLARGSRGRVTATPCGPLPAGRVAALAAEGGHVAVGIAGRGAFRADGETWTRLEGTSSLTAMTYASGGTLLVALGSESDGRAWLVEARGGDGPARTVAELGDPNSQEDDEDAHVSVLAWDDARAVVWVAGAFGLVAMRPARH